MTNGDKVRGMTNEELAGILTGDFCVAQHGSKCRKFDTCEDCCLDWLQQEADTLKIGDEVVFPFTGSKLVVYINDSKRICAMNQSNHYEGDGSSLIRTGRHFPQVEELFKAMKGEKNGN